MAIRNENGYSTTVLNIEDWDMSTATGSAAVVVSHGLSTDEWQTVRNIQAIIRDDTNAAHYPIGTINNAGTGAVNGAIEGWDSSAFNLIRYTTGFFDSADFNSTSYNRGWITFDYIAD